MTDQAQDNIKQEMPQLLENQGNPENIDMDAANQVAQVMTKEEPNATENKDGGGAPNENSAMSFWSSSNSDSDDFNDANKADAAADPTSTRRGKKGHGRSRRRRSPGSDKNIASDDERKEYDNDGGRRGRRSRSRDGSAEKKGLTAGETANGAGAAGVDQDGAGSNDGHHQRRERSSGSSGDKGRYGDRRRGSTQRKDIGSMGAGASGSRGPGGSTFRRGAGSTRVGGEFNQKGFFIPLMSKPLVSLQQFSSLQTRQSDLFGIKGQYKIYVSQHKANHASAFWKEHEKEPWFMEQYNPMTCYQIALEHQTLIQARATAFQSKIPLDLLDLTKRPDFVDGPQVHKFDPNSRTLYLKQIPTFVSRVQLREAVSSMTQGLEQIIFSRPLQMANNERFAWLVYATEEQADAAIPDLETLMIRAPVDTDHEDFKISPIKNNQTVKPPKTTPTMPVDHVARDYDLCKRLVKEVFDTERDIEFPLERLETDVESIDAKFDTLLLYMRQVHGYCFFSGIKCEDERQLAGKCGSQYLRLPPSVERVIFDSSALYGSSRLFEKTYLDKAQELLTKGGLVDKIQDPQEDELLVEAKMQYCHEKTREVVEGKKYVCKVCDKAFRTPDFVEKHIKNKHEDRLTRQNYAYFKQQARANFLNELKKTQDAQQLQHQQSAPSFHAGGQMGLNREDSGKFFEGGRGGFRGGDRGDFRGGRGNRGDDFNNRGGDRYGGRGGRGGYGNDRFMDRNQSMSMDGANDQGMDMDGDKRKNAAPQREYVDYDDPTQFDKEGQRITGPAAVQTQLQQQQQQQLQQQQLLKANSMQSEKDRQIVSYDDLF